jgi:hypothetical protein
MTKPRKRLTPAQRSRKQHHGNPLAVAVRLSKLSGGLTDGGTVAADLALNLQILVWQLTDKARQGLLDLDGTNDLAMIGNVMQFASHEAGDEDAQAKSRAWNEVIVAMRERHGRTGKVGMSGEEYQRLTDAASAIEQWVASQPVGRLRRAHANALMLANVSPLGQEVAAPVY